jgi:hypothetical protein
MPIFCPIPRTKLKLLRPLEKVIHFHVTRVTTHSNDYKRAMIAADDALHYAATHNDPFTTYNNRLKFKEADKKFRKVVHLLGGLEKDFLSKGPTSDQKIQNIGGTVSGEAKMDDKSNLKYALTVLSMLKKDLHTVVKSSHGVRFLFVLLPLNADES